ncbi:LacI-type HTH domain protein [Acididesulfobacillus acetoxydans]|uniref:LacI-type HTH domain protein n=1 Tax=Acididesulfobacillus acetoxydans TaxID=1561005 RepID=A0A8S0WQW6_9FIRM|nr:LacI family DNA-binding transcriptional regulator [Acididesulfobacillus acetoxydans]CAA7602904.1 LacI-type HTH domain protein [Acididesulfobacillus acetoxydans]CEJ05785.1 Ribose operon repressor [Acididesulfobacillus acetoxydans]
MTTIKDVAQRAGVSVTTVSRVINDSGYVGETARERVTKAMEELNFQPSRLARGLVSGKTSTIGLLIPDVANPFFADVARGIEDAAIAKGYTTILCNSDWKREREVMYLDILRSRWADGVIIAGSRSGEEVIDQATAGLPLVLVDRRGSAKRSSVWMDNERGGRLATSHLINIGCRRIVHISGPEGSPSAYGRKLGFEGVISENRARYEGLRGELIQGDFRYEGGHEIGLSLLRSKDRPDGIFAANDLMAVGILQAARFCGIEVPDELAIVGYDNIALSEYSFPSLTTIAQPGYAMGRSAFQLLLNQLGSGRNHHSEQQEFEPKLILRGSTARKQQAGT